MARNTFTLCAALGLTVISAPAALAQDNDQGPIRRVQHPSAVEQCRDVAFYREASEAEAAAKQAGAAGGGEFPDLSDISDCVALQEERLANSDDRTRWYSRASGVGGFGAVASSLAGQGAGTVNPWLALGLTPAIIDDVQQRQNWSRIRREFIGRVGQLQCRAAYLIDHHPGTLRPDGDGQPSEVETLRAGAERLDDWLWDVRRQYDAKAGADTAAGQFRLIYEEGQRQVRLARRLLAIVDGLPDKDEIRRQQAIAYNYLNTELRAFRTETLARPPLTIRSMLAMPFTTAGKIIAGGRGPADLR